MVTGHSSQVGKVREIANCSAHRTPSAGVRILNEGERSLLYHGCCLNAAGTGTPH